MSIVRSGRMRGRWSRRVTLSLSTVLVSGFAAPALAQQVGPVGQYVDANQVDLVTGNLELTFTDGVIGSGPATLALDRVGDGSAGTKLRWENVTFVRATLGGGVGQNAKFFVKLPGGYVDVFVGDRLATSLASTLGTGATLTQSYGSSIYQAADGTKIEFTDPTGGESATYCQWAYGTSSDPDCPLLLTSITRPNGGQTLFEWEINETGYDPAGVPTHIHRLSSIANSYGFRIAFDYSGAWTNRTGARFFNDAVSTSTPQASVGYSYPSAGVINVTDFAGQTWQITPTSIKRPGESTPGFSANNVTNVTSVTRDGVTTGYSRSVSGSTNTVTVTDALSNTTVTTSNLTLGVPTSVVDANGKTTTYTYDGSGRLSRVTAPEGNYVEVTLDGRGNATQTLRRDKAGNSANDITSTASYDSTCSNQMTCNQPNSVADARGNTTNYTYNSTHGGVTAVTSPDPAGASGTKPEARYGYTLTNGEYQVTSISACQTTASCASGADEVKTSVSYNGQGQVTSKSDGAGDVSLTATSSATYTPMGDVATVDGPLSGTGDTLVYRYDAARRVVGVISPDPDGAGSLKRRAEKRTYDVAGRVTVIETGTVNGTSDIDWAAFASARQVTMTYDANGRVVRKVVTASSTTYQVTQYSYDALGRLECTALRMNPANWNLTTSACTANTAGSTGPDRITKTSYDAVGRVTKVQTGYGATEQADDVTTTYTDNGKVATVTDAEGNKTTYEYDGHDRVSKTRYPNTTKGAGTSSTTDYTQPTYDANGNVTSIRLRDGTSIGYTYDTLNRPTAKNLPGSEPDVSYTYDLLGRLTGASHTGNDLTFTYDALGRNLTVRSTGLDSVNFNGTVSYEYDLAGRRTKLSWPNGQYVTYDYLVTGEVTAIRENGATSGVGVLATYAYDDQGRRTSLTFGNGVVTTYSVDNISRLSSLAHNLSGSGDDVTTSFTYSPASQIAGQTRTNDSYTWGGHYNVGRNYTSNGLNQLTAAGGTSLGYDARGNLTSSGSDSFAYSSENLLTSATVGSTSSTLQHDPLRRLYKVTVNSVGQRFLYDGFEQIAQLSDAGIMVRRYVRGPRNDEVLVEYTGPGTATRTFVQTDERGSVVARTDGTGAKVAINSYDEYGIPASGNAGRFQYTGQAWLPELGMYYYKARVYSPTLGRFMQTDPIGYGDGMNWYAYTKNDPVNKVDPSGKGIVCNDGTVIPWNGAGNCEDRGGILEFFNDGPTSGGSGGINGNGGALLSSGSSGALSGGSSGSSGGNPVIEQLCTGPVISLGISIDIVFIEGFTFDFGIFIGQSKNGGLGDFGFYGSTGKADGIDLSVGVTAGHYESRAAMNGTYYEEEVGYKSYSVSSISPSESGRATGHTVTVGPKVPVPILGRGSPASSRKTSGVGGTVGLCP